MRYARYYSFENNQGTLQIFHFFTELSRRFIFFNTYNHVGLEDLKFLFCLAKYKIYLYCRCLLSRTQSVSFLYAFFLVDLDFAGDKSLRLLVIINGSRITLKARALQKGGYEVTEKLIGRGRTAVGVVVFFCFVSAVTVRNS